MLIVGPARRFRIDPALPAGVLGLTPVESRVAVALPTAQTVAEISRAEGTVRVHLKNTYRKLGITGQTELVRRILALEAVEGSPRSL